MVIKQVSQKPVSQGRFPVKPVWWPSALTWGFNVPLSNNKATGFPSSRKLIINVWLVTINIMCFSSTTDRAHSPEEGLGWNVNESVLIVHTDCTIKSILKCRCWEHLAHADVEAVRSTANTWPTALGANDRELHQAYGLLLKTRSKIYLLSLHT